MKNCNKCCFAKVENGKQVDCLASKHKYLGFEKTKEPAATTDGFFNLDRLCLYKRSDGWESKKTTQEKLELARDQVTPNIGICIDDDSENPDDLENLIEQIVNLDYPKNRIKIIIYAYFNKAGARIPTLLAKMRSEKINCWSVFIVQDNVFENETSVFKKLNESTFLSKMSSTTKINLQKTVEQINRTANDELQPVLVFKSQDSYFINKTYVSNSYLKYQDYNKMQEAILKKVTNTEYLYNIL
jgi:hypothetical protein